jgi:hypothetical protein
MIAHARLYAAALMLALGAAWPAHSETSVDASVASDVSAADRAVLDRVVTALQQDPLLQGASISVLLDNDGQLVLEGTTLDDDQADHANSVAQEAAGGSVTVVDGLDATPDLSAPRPASTL